MDIREATRHQAERTKEHLLKVRLSTLMQTLVDTTSRQPFRQATLQVSQQLNHFK